MVCTHLQSEGPSAVRDYFVMWPATSPTYREWVQPRGNVSPHGLHVEILIFSPCIPLWNSVYYTHFHH